MTTYKCRVYETIVLEKVHALTSAGCEIIGTRNAGGILIFQFDFDSVWQAVGGEGLYVVGDVLRGADVPA